jgi:predicted nucleic acid-binding protein
VSFQPLAYVPSGGRIFIDSSILIYHAIGASQECRALMRRSETGDVAASTSTIVIAEVTHRLMMIEAVKLGLVRGKDVVKKLRAKPELVKRLSAYQEQVEQIPLMGVAVLPLDLATLLRSAELRERYGLLVNDSLVAGAALSAEIDSIASADADFGRVDSLRLFRPTDLG